MKLLEGKETDYQKGTENPRIKTFTAPVFIGMPKIGLT